TRAFLPFVRAFSPFAHGLRGLCADLWFARVPVFYASFLPFVRAFSPFARGLMEFMRGPFGFAQVLVFYARISSVCARFLSFYARLNGIYARTLCVPAGSGLLRAHFFRLCALSLLLRTA
ncbi:hypothetical protein, partial [Cytobacillus sp. Bac17]|uniref:hypothetical protein n=1 Tax=Cytobacillus sp. Bac17 TaxID=2926008 RepID=UPI0021181B3E